MNVHLFCPVGTLFDLVSGPDSEQLAGHSMLLSDVEGLACALADGAQCWYGLVPCWCAASTAQGTVSRHPIPMMDDPAVACSASERASQIPSVQLVYAQRQIIIKRQRQRRLHV